jgi:hypothetical protein
MRWLLFLSRLSFICGICFLVSLSFLMMKTDNQDLVSSTIIVIGCVIGLVVITFTVLCYLGMMFSRHKPGKFIPAWLIISNIVFLFVLLFYIFYLNDPYYH